MRRRTVTLPARDLGDLLKPPHVLSQFMDAITKKQQLTSDQQEQARKHLARCIHCQSFLGSYLVSMLKDNKTSETLKKEARELLTQLKSIIHETLAADTPAYVDELVENGQEEADNRFPFFAEHLQSCQDCQGTVQDLQIWLKQ
jgi:hypothetical protein